MFHELLNPLPPLPFPFPFFPPPYRLKNLPQRKDIIILIKE